MQNRTLSSLQQYGLALIATSIALGLTLTVDWFFIHTPFALFYVAVAVSAWYGGVRASIVTTILGVMSVRYFMFTGGGSPDLTENEIVRILVFLLVATIVSVLGLARVRALERVRQNEEWLGTTLRSIGDAVIATDDRGCVTFMNPIAQELTGWSQEEGVGRPLVDVFNIVNEMTRKPVENPVAKVLADGAIVGLANHTVLLAKGGREIPIEDSAAPIMDPNGTVRGVIMVFHDITQRRHAELQREFLVNAGELLSSSLDYQITLTRVAELAVPHLADWCSIDMIADDGSVQQLAVTHVEPEKVRWAQELRRTHPPDMSAPTGLPNVLRTGQPEFYPLITDEMLVATARTPEDLELRRRIGFTSVIIVPFVVEGRPIGAITLVTAESGRRYDESDLALAIDLARRATTSIDNARLYRHAQASTVEAQTQTVRMQILADSSRVFAEAPLDLSIVLEAVVRQIAELKECLCMIRLASDDRQWLKPMALHHTDPEVVELVRHLVEADTSRADDGILGRVFTTGEPVLIPAVPQDRIREMVDPVYHPFLDRYGFHSLLVVPLMIQGEALGTLGVVRIEPGRPLTEEDLSMVRDLADRAALAIGRARLLREIDAQREWFQVTLSSIGDAVIATDTTSAVTFMNKVAEELTGWTSVEALGRDLGEVFDIVNEYTREPVESPVAKVLRDGMIVGLANHTILLGRHGREIPIDDSAAPIMDADGRLIGVVMVFHDITERREGEREKLRLLTEVQQQQQRLDAIVSSVPGVVWEAWGQPDEQSQRIDFVSRYVEQMLGYTREEWLATPNFWLSIVHPDDRERAAREATAIFTGGGTGESQFRWMHRDGRAIFVEARSAVICADDGTPLGMRGVTMDITERKHAEQALRESEERFRMMANSAPALIWLADNTPFHRNYFNRAWLDFRGRTIEEEMGDGWMEGIHPHDREHCDRTLSEAFVRQRSWRMEYRLRHADGTYHWILATGVPRVLADGTLEGYIGCCFDIHERKNAEIRLTTQYAVAGILARSTTIADALPALLRAICENLGWLIGSFWLIDDTNGILRNVELWKAPNIEVEEFEHATRTMTFAPGAGLPGRVWSLRHPMWIDDIGKDPSFPRTSTLSYSAYAFPVLLHDQVYGVAEFFDHHLPEPDDALLEMMHTLGSQISQFIQRTRAESELKEAKEIAEAANQAKDQFLAMLSHELRTPLTPVLALSQALENDPELPEEMQEMVEIIRRNVELEARLIDDLLDLTRIAREKFPLNLATVDVHTSIRSAVDICRSDIDTKGLTITLALNAASHHAHADPARLQQVFWNLLKNAIKFTPEEGAITVRTGNGPGGELTIEIIDTGIGIEPEVLPRIFDAFEQGEQTITRHFGGLGLGLAISKSLVELHGGTLTATSAGRDRGATFTITLATLSVDAEKTELAAPPTSSENQGIRILFVDDHEDTVSVNKLLLERQGYRVITANSVASALRIAMEHPIDLLISDIGLPDGTGIDLMKRIRKERTVPAIALSGFGMEEDIQRSIEAGFTVHLTKPITFQKLREIIQRLTS